MTKFHLVSVFWHTTFFWQLLSATTITNSNIRGSVEICHLFKKISLEVHDFCPKVTSTKHCHHEIIIFVAVKHIMAFVDLNHVGFLISLSVVKIINYWESAPVVVTFFNHNFVNCKATLILAIKNLRNNRISRNDVHT